MARSLSARRRATLEAIADTFASGAAERGVVDAFLEKFVARLPAGEQARLSALLGVSAARRFPRLSRSRRERVLLSWGRSRLSLRRTGFHALRKGLLLLAWTLPGAPWDELAYPGPPGPDPEAPPKPLSPVVPDGKLELSCDVCVVGSGAGGAAAAAVLAGAGLDVVVLEAGGYFGPPDFDGAELPGLERLYLGAGAPPPPPQGNALPGASCAGGGDPPDDEHL